MDALKKFCLAYDRMWIIVGSCAVLELAIWSFYGLRHPAVTLLATVFVVLLGGGFMLNDAFLRYKRLFDRRMADFASQGLTDFILTDFQRNRTLFMGNLIVGEHCLIGKGNGLIVSYEEIRAMWIQREYEDGNYHIALYVFCADKERRLCYLPGVYREEVRSALPEEKNEYRPLCDTVLSKNPDVMLCRDRQEVRTLFR